MGAVLISRASTPVRLGSVAPQGTPQPSIAPAPRNDYLPRTEYPPLVRYSRWEKSSSTFGPFGRLFATFLLLLPLPVFLITVAVGVGIIGAILYVVVVMPWALRDIWKKAVIRLDNSAPAPAPPRF